MKKRLIIIFIAIILIIVICELDIIVGEPSITGKASQQATNLSVTVISELPILTIITPENTTYSTTTLFFNYSAINADTIWYSLDSVTNITLTGPINITTTEGSHTLYLYANNTEGGINWTSVTFFIALEEPGDDDDGPGPSPPRPSCTPNWECDKWSDCLFGVKTRDCIDKNKCGVKTGKPEESVSCFVNISEQEIVYSYPGFECKEWSKCRAVYSLNNLITGNVLLEGRQHCLEDILKIKSCNPGEEIIIRKASKCFRDYLEILNVENTLISKMQLIREFYQKLNVDITIKDSEYCYYCFDKKKNYDEDEIDCVYEENGNCPVCMKQSLKKEILSLIVFFILIFLFIILLIIYLGLLFLEKRNKKA